MRYRWHDEKKYKQHNAEHFSSSIERVDETIKKFHDVWWGLRTYGTSEGLDPCNSAIRFWNFGGVSTESPLAQMVKILPMALFPASCACSGFLPAANPPFSRRSRERSGMSSMRGIN